ncbi:DUF4350 domain-containing protein [Mycolicibacterium grossiae]|uniref:DUF4350 domain-containing protein n=1 Tax=Mycolicibacterium grossiae TaxID=1552759 RepID=UPI0009F4B2A9|nr:DUF4350 domain-containing protein [Mycolicibacterium grossiae]QEM43999.1 DUF4350 domain-containing protein [Mycolicibacterium grossiae]
MTGITAVGPTVGQRWGTVKWVLVALLAITAVSLLSTWLTAPRPGAPLAADSTSPDGARALVTLLRDEGVTVVEARSLADVAREARPDTLLVVAQTYFLVDDDGLDALADLPGDRLLVAPVSRAREVLAPDLAEGEDLSMGGDPDCDLPAARRAGRVQLDGSATYGRADGAGDVTVTRCYDGALAQYRADGRTVTAVGDASFLTNAGLPKEGNAALAMNLVGSRERVIWYVPTFVEGESDASASITDLIPDRVTWLVLQLCLVVALVAVWRSRRVGPLVAEDLPVVVRASETVEGRGRLYRAHRARDRAADALRTGTLQRMLPRLGLSAGAAPAAVAQAVAGRIGGDPDTHHHRLFGPPPATDDGLVTLARHLDDIERQVTHS